MLRTRQHLHKTADLHICSQNAVADDQANRVVGKFFDQALDDCDSVVMGISYAKNNLKIRIILNAVTSEILVSFRIISTERFKNAYGWEVLRS